MTTKMKTLTIQANLITHNKNFRTTYTVKQQEDKKQGKRK